MTVLNEEARETSDEEDPAERPVEEGEESRSQSEGASQTAEESVNPAGDFLRAERSMLNRSRRHNQRGQVVRPEVVVRGEGRNQGQPTLPRSAARIPL